eukprot:m.105677 g.105677  ORF g.105677 m.105677 type:complete len:55 (+) comp12658_c1_seq3:3126-3290(+)
MDLSVSFHGVGRSPSTKVAAAVCDSNTKTITAIKQTDDNNIFQLKVVVHFKSNT